MTRRHGIAPSLLYGWMLGERFVVHAASRKIPAGKLAALRNADLGEIGLAGSVLSSVASSVSPWTSSRRNGAGPERFRSALGWERQFSGGRSGRS